MRILVADDDEVSCLALEAMLTRRGHEAVIAADGAAAWRVLEGQNPPPLAILNWMMPELEGVEVCRRVRATARLSGIHLILLTSRDRREHVVEGLRAGADDYVAKPFHHDELEARINVGVRMAQLQAELTRRVTELEGALEQVKRLQGLLPICSYCKKIRDDQKYWREVGDYLMAHSEAQVSHGVCPVCWEKVVKPECEKLGIPLPDECPE